MSVSFQQGGATTIPNFWFLSVFELPIRTEPGWELCLKSSRIERRAVRSSGTYLGCDNDDDNGRTLSSKIPTCLLSTHFLQIIDTKDKNILWTQTIVYCLK